MAQTGEQGTENDISHKVRKESRGEPMTPPEKLSFLVLFLSVKESPRYDLNSQVQDPIYQLRSLAFGSRQAGSWEALG